MASPTHSSPAWLKLRAHAPDLEQPVNHLKNLIGLPHRLQDCSTRGGGIFFDYSRQRVLPQTLDLLLSLAQERKANAQFRRMMQGDRVNVTEERAALHTAVRDFSESAIKVDATDVMPEIRKIRADIRRFCKQIHAGAITGSTGKPFRDIVVIGIGGSYLGTEFVSTALEAFTRRDIRILFLSNVDIHNFARIERRIDPERTLWIVISKSFTTAETLANLNQAETLMASKGIDPSAHIVTVTAKGSPGDDPPNPALRAFHMFDFIGGRYSVTSAVGAVPLSLYLGNDIFERFLNGAEEMDQHARNADYHMNVPLIAALLSIWNTDFLGYPACAVIPYADPLRKLSAHIQQLVMESNGKGVSITGEPLDPPTGTIVFGEPGTNAQHSFFQLAHQGNPFPVDFIGILNPQYDLYPGTSKGVTNHQELWANLISQPLALAIGKKEEDPARCFSGNRPSSTILLEDLTPENVGRLLSFYEAKTVYEAFIRGINPFDQFGVELGKEITTDIRVKIAEKNKHPDAKFNKVDPISRFYLDTLFRGNF